ncbi:pilus assembly protein PilP [Halomonas cerina]|uniref:Type IV pilus assembly protein PilP n=1 Tax=Halomonas cerina TaxID=447424 RepID=A0A839VDP3_9GAMM|nr:pilus assembly protein PilP [Halomonas cerina]MBB3190784.1 type IV pilus assembly protein PilP [Halomonas cerina]
MSVWPARGGGVALLVALAGCSDANLDTLERELASLRADPGVDSLLPLPPLPDTPAVDYRFADERSPFQARLPEPEALPPGESDLEPDRSRPREPLEAFDLSALELVGTLSVGGQPSALVRAPDGTVHRLRVGDHLGSDFGRIVGITGRSVQLVEIVPTGRGDWVERSTRLTLDDQQAGNDQQ